MLFLLVAAVDSPKRSKSTITVFFEEVLWFPPPEVIVYFIDLSAWVIESYLTELEATFLDSLRYAWVFLDFSLILLSSSA